MISAMARLMWLVLLPGGAALAAPNHFAITIGSALVCNDQVNAEYLNGYMKRFFGVPSFSKGGANWWRVDENIFNAPSKYVFVGVEQDFIGATFKDDPGKLADKVKDAMGIAYRQSGAERWVAPTYGVIIKYDDIETPSKMYCIGTPHTDF